jgi:hypothetical protein
MGIFKAVRALFKSGENSVIKPELAALNKIA